MVGDSWYYWVIKYNYCYNYNNNNYYIKKIYRTLDNNNFMSFKDNIEVFTQL